MRTIEAPLKKRGLTDSPSEANLAEVTNDAVDLFMTKGVTALRQTIKDDAPLLLYDRERLNRWFQRRLKKRRGRALDQYHLIAIVCQQIGEEAYRRDSRRMPAKRRRSRPSILGTAVIGVLLPSSWLSEISRRITR